jgi:hypothetical protein
MKGTQPLQSPDKGMDATGLESGMGIVPFATYIIAVLRVKF